MRLLIVTQTVDQTDPALGFFTGWIEEFATHCEQVVVICLRKGEFQLPANVQVYSLGKEKGKRSKLGYAIAFKKLIWKHRNEYDSVFVHMNPEYVVLGGLFWKLWKKPVALWYLHRQVDLKLRIATMLASVVLSASPESFRLPTRKLRIVGHGVDTTEQAPLSNSDLHTPLRLITIGRITKAKGLHTILDALEKLHAQGIAFTCTIVGSATAPGDAAYEAELRSRVAQEPFAANVSFAGAKPHAEIATLLETQDLFLHASSGTGSLDKAVLESLLAGVPVVSTSPAFVTPLASYGLAVHDAQSMATIVSEYVKRTDTQAVRKELRDWVLENHSLARLVPRILAILQNQKL